MDITILLWMQNLREILGDGFAYIALLLSDALALIAIVLPFVTFWCLNKRRGQLMLAVFSGSLLLNQIIKMAAAVYRPWIRDSRITPPDFAKKSATGYSFPSSHTQIAATAYGDLGAESWKSNKKLSIGFFLLIVLAGVLRMFLGVHTPQDILVGMLCALLMIPVCWLVFDQLAAHREKEIMFAVIFVFFTAAAVVFALNKNYPMDYMNGELLVDPHEMLKDFMLSAGLSMALVCGGIIEHRIVCFSTECPLKTKIFRTVTGLLGAGLIYLLTKLTGSFLPPLFNSLLRGLLIGFYAVLFHPMLFKKIEEKRNSSVQE